MTGAFTGEIGTPLALRLLGERIIRKLRIKYAYTPPWPYYDIRRHKEHLEEFHLALSLSAWAIPRRGKGKSSFAPLPGPYWAPLDQLLSVGVLRPSVYDQLRAQIDAEAMNADRNNRMNAGLPVPPLPEQI